MKRPIDSVVRKSVLALVAGASLLTAATAFAGTNGQAIEQLHQKQAREQQQRQQSQQAQPQPQAQAPQQAQPQETQRREPGAPHADAPLQRPPQQGVPRSAPPRYTNGGGNGWQTQGPGGRVVPTVPGARVAPSPRYYAGRPPHYVPVLPPGHRRYDWNGGAYFYGGGHWYRPYHNTYVTVGVPFGLFMPYLPGAYSTFWVGGTRYYYSENIYYTYEPQRHGYVVARSPYGDDPEYSDEQGGGDNGRDEDVYIYPMRGQSEQQQADDRYECHRWAVKETHYDPTDSSYDRNDRSDYDRALTACLTGRGYSVK